MNRRSFIYHLSAGIALVGSGAAAQRGSATSTVLVSEITGAEIDFTASEFTLEHQEVKMVIGGDAVAHDHEHIHFITGHGKLEIELLASGAYDWKRDMADFLASYKRDYTTVEEYAYEDLADGGYSVVGFDTTAVYHEYQLGAFPDVDMRVILWTDQQAFHDELALAQTILVGGAAPFLYTPESKVEEVVFGSSAQTSTSTTSTRSTRNTAGNQATTTSTTSTTGTSGSESIPAAAGSDSEYVEIIVAHREEFLTSYNLFMDHLDVLAMDTTTEAEKSDLFVQMYEISLEWKEYPDTAMAPAVPSSLTELSTLYVQWALSIGEMGSLFEEIYNGLDRTDAFIASVSDWELLDAELETALAQYGFQSPQRPSGAIATIRNGLRAAWSSLR